MIPSVGEGEFYEAKQVEDGTSIAETNNYSQLQIPIASWGAVLVRCFVSLE